MLNLSKKILTPAEPAVKCKLCGNTTGLVYRTFYAGGQGLVSQWECKDGCCR